MSDRIEYDVVLVGGSPSNLALAHHLLDMAKESGASFTMAILEKGKEFGAHICSGAVSNPRVIQKLFPNYNDESSTFPLEGICNDSTFSVLGYKNKWDVPNSLLPKGLKKEGYLILTLSHVVYWMAKELEKKAAELENVEVDMFPGFSAHQVVYETVESGGERIAGVQIVEKATGNPDEDNIYGKMTIFGDKGFVSGDIIKRYQLRDTNQIWSVGVKEVWQLPENLDFSGKVWHTMGYPLVDGSFGGGFVYGMKNNKLTVGLIASLDSPNPNLNPQQMLQEYKKHPWLQEILKDAKLLKYGAALLPEGGYYSLPKRFNVDGGMFLGDALGILDVSCLSGIDKSMETGWIAAELLHDAIQAGDYSQARFDSFREKVMSGWVGQELKEGRYFRKAWQENPRLLNNYLPTVMDGIDGPGPIVGLVSVGLKHNPLQAMGDANRLKTLMEGKKDIGQVNYKKDWQHIEPDFKPAHAFVPPAKFNKDTVYSRADAVFFANTKYHEDNEHIDEFESDTCVKCIQKYDALQRDVPCVSDCTAEVHRVDLMDGIRKHGMSLENCVQCRTCEFVCPEENLKVRPTEQGSGPDFVGL